MVSQPIHTVRCLYDQKVPMRDGVRLSADVYVPREGTRFPTILLRTPYESTRDGHVDWAVWWAQRGYTCVIEDNRGKFESEGAFYPYRDDGPDGHDTLEWIANQTWCNGKIGTSGRSYGGLFQMKFAADQILPGPIDQRPIERRDDVLVYTSPILEQDLEVTGPLELVLYAASSARDTDFTAKLVDVHPTGGAIHIAEGIIRARYRNGFTHAELLEPGEVAEYHIELAATSNVFLRGHRLRLEISSSNFPRFNRNLNTGEHVATGTRWEIAQQTILHSSAYPSHILLPLIPG